MTPLELPGSLGHATPLILALPFPSILAVDRLHLCLYRGGYSPTRLPGPSFYLEQPDRQVSKRNLLTTAHGMR